MLLSLRADHKEHLNILMDHNTQVLIDFCKLSIDFLQNGPNFKLYAGAASKMNEDPEKVQNCVFGLLNLLILSCRNKLSDNDFRDSVLTIGFTSEQQVVLNKFYFSKKAEITEILQQFAVKEPHFYDLDWRFEVQIASRSLLHQVNPLITMDLKLKTENSNENTESHRILQTDPTTLLRITNELENALQESKSRHSRRIQQAFVNINKV